LVTEITTYRGASALSTGMHSWTLNAIDAIGGAGVAADGSRFREFKVNLK
jgi:hypothetical protein